MLHQAESHLLYEARARGERYRAEAQAHVHATEALRSHAAPRMRGALAAALARLARTLAAVAEDLDPQVGRPSWEPRI
jgi:hypothetical protein